MAVKLRTEFTVKIAHQPGELARVLALLAKGGVNVLGFCGYGMPDGANIMFVPADDAKARKALAGAGLAAVEAPVVCVTTTSGKGAGAKLAAKLGKAGINIEYAYATTSGTGQGTAIFRVVDAAATAAAGVLK